MYDREMNKKELTFGVSGLLYESNVLLYDHQTESLWSQLKEEAVTGPQTGTRLRAIPSVMTTWKAWRAQHPNTLVLIYTNRIPSRLQSFAVRGVCQEPQYHVCGKA